MKIQQSITINAPLQRVFDVFTDLETATEHIDGIQRIEVLEGTAQMSVGTKWRETRKFFGKEAEETMWVTALDQNKNYVVEADSRGVKYMSTYTFSHDSGETNVVMTFEVKPHSLSAKLMSPLGFLMKGATEKALRSDLEDLKAVAEK